jgi:hypothetical protein
MGYLFTQEHLITLVNLKLFVMQEPIDNDYREFLDREEELMMMEKEELIKHINRLEAEFYANQQDKEELPW